MKNRGPTKGLLARNSERILLRETVDGRKTERNFIRKITKRTENGAKCIILFLKNGTKRQNDVIQHKTFNFELDFWCEMRYIEVAKTI